MKNQATAKAVSRATAGQRSAARAAGNGYPHPVTLAVDIGGSGVKLMALDERGNALTERLRIPTPDPATPARILAALEKMKKQMPACDRCTVGFPGVIKHGKSLTAVNLSPRWDGFPLQATLEKRWKLPVCLANDAAVQGYGAIHGKGVEMVITLGTGMGSALFTNGHLCPGLELGHHPWRKKKTYEEFLGLKGLKKLGKKRWNRLAQEAIAQTAHTFNWDHLYIGGGNAKLINFTLPDNVSIISNEDGLFGGVAIWRYQD